MIVPIRTHHACSLVPIAYTLNSEEETQTLLYNIVELIEKNMYRSVIFQKILIYIFVGCITVY